MNTFVLAKVFSFLVHGACHDHNDMSKSRSGQIFRGYAKLQYLPSYGPMVTGTPMSNLGISPVLAAVGPSRKDGVTELRCSPTGTRSAMPDRHRTFASLAASETENVDYRI